MTAYPRDCPRCKTTFAAVTERGICPQCGLFSAIRADGSFVATRALFTALDGDEPLTNDPLGNVYAAAEYGGAPLVESWRHDGFPSVDICHAELRQEFERLKQLLAANIPEMQSTAISDPKADADWTGSDYESASELHVLRWVDEGHRIELVCSLTSDGGNIHVLRDGIMKLQI